MKTAMVLLAALGMCASCKRADAPEEAPPRHGDPETTNARVPSGDVGKRDIPAAQPLGALETVALFDGAMPTGVTVSQSGRIFVNFPRWGDDVAFTVAEVKGGNAVAYPNADINRASSPGQKDLDKRFVSVQSVVVDPKDRLWVLDTGAPLMGTSELGGPKLVGVDLGTNAVVKTIVLPRNVAGPTSYMNDVRFDLTRGKAGMAFITDSSASGPNGIVVVDLDTGKSWRKLHDHPSTKPDPSFQPIVEGRPLVQNEPGKPAQKIAIGSDGIAISGDGKTLYYCPLASRHLYSVSVDQLADPAASETAVAATVKDLGEKGASDGLESDAQGRVYATNYEANAILRRKTDGTLETIATDPRLLWPDTLSLADDGFLYVTANQLHRQAKFQGGRDARQKPYVLFRVKVDGTPVRLGR